MKEEIIKKVRVDRNRTPQQVLNATSSRQYVNDSVVQAMPQGVGEEAEVCFFSVRRDISDDDLEKEFALRSLKPVDPYSLAAVNEADPAFADDHPNATHWQDGGDNWCYAAFRRWDGGRDVYVHRNDVGWSDDWWFAGLRKYSDISPSDHEPLTLSHSVTQAIEIVKEAGYEVFKRM